MTFPTMSPASHRYPTPVGRGTPVRRLDHGGRALPDRTNGGG